MRINLYEVFDKIKEMTNTEEKVKYIRTFNENIMKTIFTLMYSKELKFYFNKENCPKYERSKVEIEYNNIFTILDKLYLFQIGNKNVAPELTLERRTKLFSDMISTMESREVDLLLEILSGGYRTEGIDLELIRILFPTLRIV